MGNCQAAEAETVLIMHPGNKIERLCRSVSARHVMNSNPGHYVAVVVTRSENGMLVKQLKLLRPDDSLLIGKVYRLICFQDILKEFAEKKCVKLGKLLKERGVLVLETKGVAGAPVKESNASSVKSHMGQHGGNNNRNRSRMRSRKHHQHQWKPALKSITENEN
ncbi:hypothetical protein L1987_36767 [Smallanthus sonchifolius]|uniref:Uncharacterized protein n=1 Tax=Smallanthus sonchifolius TaxID=185202 RepID=A0ACB9HFV6_9ASTR|nr:hypothetical protein L1987_36767 [Smallanthus sonchifolius]